MTNYWSFNGNVNDTIGNANLYGGVNVSLISDRFGRSNSALSLQSGYYRVPAGVYFNGTQLTIMAWVKVKNHQINSRLIDFGNGPWKENIVLTLSTGTNGKPYLFLQSGIDHFAHSSTISLNLNKWHHLSCTFSFPFYSIYIDGFETTMPGSKTTFLYFNLKNVVRIYNFIGRSNWNERNVDVIILIVSEIKKKRNQFDINILLFT